jgi:ribonuclease HI
MFFDGSLMKTGAGAGLLFISPLGKHLRYVVRLHFPASNNVAEYKALVNGLRIAIELGVRRLDARGDSQLVIDQVMKNSHCRDVTPGFQGTKSGASHTCAKEDNIYNNRVYRDKCHNKIRVLIT